jgi:hypothetical protein
MDRALGNPLGNPLGLPKAAGFQPKATTYTRIVTGEGVLIPPEGAKLMRVAVIGGGGGAWLLNGGSSCAGSGGGCSASQIVPAVSIKYVIGLGGLASATQAQTIGGATTAEFGAYSLLAQGGQGTSSGVGPGGAGFGGDYNYQGGYAYRADAGYSAGGGGAAGPCGSGGSGSQTNGTGYPGQLLSGWGCGGGGGGAAYSSANTTLNRGGGGGGAGGAGATVFASSGDIRQPYQAGPIFGLAANSPTAFNYPSAGGEVGGGGGVTVSGSSPYTAYGGNGGSGGLVVEWFY